MHYTPNYTKFAFCIVGYVAVWNDFVSVSLCLAVTLHNFLARLRDTNFTRCCV